MVRSQLTGQRLDNDLGDLSLSCPQTPPAEELPVPTMWRTNLQATLFRDLLIFLKPLYYTVQILLWRPAFINPHLPFLSVQPFLACC